MKRKIIKALLASVCLLSSTNISAHDITVKNTDGVSIYYNFTNDSTELTVTRRGSAYNCYSGNVVIPESVIYNGNTYSVTTIGEEAFFESSHLISVSIPNSVTTIGDHAFYLCSSLTLVTIPNSVTFIGDGAFGHCGSLASVTIPNNVTFIGGGAFAYCI